MQEIKVWSLGGEDSLEKRMETTPVFLHGKFHGIAKSQTWLNTHTHLLIVFIEFFFRSLNIFTIALSKSLSANFIISVIYVSVSTDLFFLAKDHIFMFSHISGNLFTRFWILCHVVECLIFLLSLKKCWDLFLEAVNLVEDQLGLFEVYFQALLRRI